jgi:hypothetical protein
VFVDDVLAELTAMAREGTRPQRSGPKPPLERFPPDRNPSHALIGGSDTPPGYDP